MMAEAVCEMRSYCPCLTLQVLQFRVIAVAVRPGGLSYKRLNQLYLDQLDKFNAVRQANKQAVSCWLETKCGSPSGKGSTRLQLDDPWDSTSGRYEDRL